MKLEVGMKLFKVVHNRRSDNTLEEVIIEKVGRKYFYIDKPTYHNDRYDIPKKEELEKKKWGSFYLNEDDFFVDRIKSEKSHKIYMYISRNSNKLRCLDLKELETIEKIIFKEDNND